MDNETSNLTPMQRAVQAADTLIKRGVPVPLRNDLIAVIYSAISQAEAEARTAERHRVTAEWLCQVLPGEVIREAAERITGQAY